MLPVRMVTLLLICLLALPVDADELPSTSPESVGLSAVRLDEFRKSLEQDIAEDQLAGAVMLVLREGKIAAYEAVGRQDVENDVPMSTDTIFRIASMTKPVTSVAIMQLVEQGKIALNDPVAKFIPEFASQRVLKAPVAKGNTEQVETVPAEREVTIADLLTHTSGIVYKFGAPEPLFSLYTKAGVSDGLVSQPQTIDENMQRLGPLPLLHQPGERWTYGLSIDVLGRIVEVVSGQPLDEYFHEHIFAPLGMVDTGFEIPEQQANRLAALYHADDQGRIVRTNEQHSEGQLTYSPDYPLQRPQTYFSGGAGLVSTAMDYARFCQMLLNRGQLDGVQVLKPETVDLMTQNHIGDLEILYQIHGDKFGYGFAVTSDEFAEKDDYSAGSYSWGGLYYTYFWIDPDEKLVGILMAQKFPYGQLQARERFKAAVYDALIEEEAPVQSATPAPKPGDRYREYAVHNDGNLNWRVTDPHATAEGAQQFLPNPVLELTVDSLKGATHAELLLDRWGGHLKTTNKQIRINGGEWITVPELATTPAGHPPEMYYAQDNPVVAVPLSMLREGTNTIEGRCRTIRDYNWGQWGLYSAILRVHVEGPVQLAAAPRIVWPASGATLSEDPTIRVEAFDHPVDRVDVMAWYYGYDENGDGVFTDWHRAYFQPQRGDAADISYHVGTASSAPFEVTWDTTWVPDQQPGTIRLLARVQTTDGIWQVTPIVDDLTLERTDRSVQLYVSSDVPEAFGVRVGQTKSCMIEIPGSANLSHARRAIMHLRTWHGDPAGHDWLKLNGQEIALAGNNHHYDHDLLPVPVSALQSGANTVSIYSQTTHHMLEILWPGPGLVVEYRQ